MPNFQCKEVCQSPEDGKEEARSKGFLNNRKDQCLPGVGRGREPWQGHERTSGGGGGNGTCSTVPGLLAPGGCSLFQFIKLCL